MASVEYRMFIFGYPDCFESIKKSYCRLDSSLQELYAFAKNVLVWTRKQQDEGFEVGKCVRREAFYPLIFPEKNVEEQVSEEEFETYLPVSLILTDQDQADLNYLMSMYNLKTWADVYDLAVRLVSWIDDGREELSEYGRYKDGGFQALLLLDFPL